MDAKEIVSLLRFAVSEYYKAIVEACESLPEGQRQHTAMHQALVQLKNDVIALVQEG